MVSNLCGVHRNTAAVFFSRPRQTISFGLEATIEVDESYFAVIAKAATLAPTLLILNAYQAELPVKTSVSHRFGHQFGHRLFAALDLVRRILFPKTDPQMRENRVSSYLRLKNRTSYVRRKLSLSQRAKWGLNELTIRIGVAPGLAAMALALRLAARSDKLVGCDGNIKLTAMASPPRNYEVQRQCTKLPDMRSI